MYITRLSIEKEYYSIDEIKQPTWEQVKDAILSLEGENRTSICISYEDRQGDTKDFMTIAGGGKNKLYTCLMYSYEEDEWVLYDPSKSWHEEIEIMRDLQLSTDPAALGFDFKTVLVAAETYSRFGVRDTSLHWIESLEILNLCR